MISMVVIVMMDPSVASTIYVEKGTINGTFQSVADNLNLIMKEMKKLREDVSLIKKMTAESKFLLDGFRFGIGWGCGEGVHSNFYDKLQISRALS